MKNAWTTLDLYLFAQSRFGRLLIYLIICAVVAGIAIWAIGGIDSEIAQLHTPVHTKASEQLARKRIEASEDETRMRAFKAILVNAKDYPKILSKMWISAEESGIKLRQAEYRTELDRKGGFSKIMIVMPVAAPYPVLKKYAFKQLSDFPCLALSKFEIKSDQSKSASIEAELMFTLLVSGK